MMTDKQVQNKTAEITRLQKQTANGFAAAKEEDGLSGFGYLCSDTNHAILERERQLKHELAIEFGRRNGWNIAHKDFAAGQLARRSNQSKRDEYLPGHSVELDHPYCYREPDRPYRPAAIAVHLYTEPEHVACLIEPFASEHGLTWEVETGFPSWHNPGRTTLVVYRPTIIARRSKAANTSACMIEFHPPPFGNPARSARVTSDKRSEASLITL